MEQGYMNSQSTTVLSAPWATTVEETIKEMAISTYVLNMRGLACIALPRKTDGIASP